jgi:hypothetical protein
MANNNKEDYRMSNPFDTGAGINPFGGNVISEAFKSATTEAEASVLNEVSDLARAAHNLDSQMSMATKTKNPLWLLKLKGFALRLGEALLDFVKRAIELAIFKLVLELCAMIMNSIMAALTKKGMGPMDVSTPGIYMQKTATAGTQSSAAPSYTSGSNPFSGTFGQSSAVSPW